MTMIYFLFSHVLWLRSVETNYLHRMYGFFQMNLEFKNALRDLGLMALDFSGANGKNVLHVVDVDNVVVTVVILDGLDVNGKVVSTPVVETTGVVLNVIPRVVLVVLPSAGPVSSVSMLAVVSS